MIFSVPKHLVYITYHNLLERIYNHLYAVICNDRMCDMNITVKYINRTFLAQVCMSDLTVTSPSETCHTTLMNDSYSEIHSKVNATILK